MANIVVMPAAYARKKAAVGRDDITALGFYVGIDKVPLRKRVGCLRGTTIETVARPAVW